MERIRQEIRRQLEQAAQPDYQAFSQKLLPGVPNICGVRLPQLRRMAKQAAKKDAQSFLDSMQAADWQGDVLFEEKMLYGFVIGYARLSDAQRAEQLDVFVPLIDSWSLCDSCCATYQWMRAQPAFWWDYLLGWLEADTEFSVRFAFAAMLNHFVDAAHIEKIFEVCSRVRQEGYYAKMAQAWLVSVCFAAFPHETYAFLENDGMDDFTHQKTIQKICESYRVSKEWKASVRGLRR